MCAESALIFDLELFDGMLFGGKAWFRELPLHITQVLKVSDTNAVQPGIHAAQLRYCMMILDQMTPVKHSYSF